MSLQNRSRAHLNTSLDCADAALCVLAPQSGVRSSVGLLLTMLVPILLGSVQSVHMRWAYRRLPTKILDITLRIFFPEGILWLVLGEEREREYVMKELKSMSHSSTVEEVVSPATNQQLMAVQAGKLYLDLVGSGARDNSGGLAQTDNRNDTLATDEICGFQPALPLGHPTPGSAPFTRYEPIREQIIPPYPVSHPPSLRSPSPVFETPHGYLALPRRTQDSSDSMAGVASGNSIGSNVSRWADQAYPKVVWTCRKPSRMRRLELGDLNEFSSILSMLPNGQTSGTPGGISFPDLTFFILLFQDAWLLSTIITRLLSRKQQYKISVLEIFAAFSLTTFLLERIITKNHKPAWTHQYAIIQMDKSTYQPPFPISHRHRFEARNPLLLPAAIVSAAFTVLWCVGLFTYASMSGPAYHTQVACQASAVAYIVAILYFLLLKMIDKQGREPLGNWTRWLPPKWCVYALAGMSRLVVVAFAIVQVFWGEKEIFDGPVIWGTLPHIAI